MCGLVGLLCSTADSAAAARAEVVEAMVCQRHRGPDETASTVAGAMVFGFNRLAFIDLEHAHQPLPWGPPENPERYMLLFNGEIYNYLELRAELIEAHGAEFRTEGDGEVIAVGYHHVGPDWVSRLRGMFAFVIYDTATGELFGARDPFGIK
ncbi:MAG: asparagine synthase (glutamine-hydrolyzing), partial [Sciscionella sp.]